MVMLQNFYHPQTKLQEDNVFTPVCDSVHGGGGLFHRDPPPYGGRAGGIHSTGMHSCLQEMYGIFLKSHKFS